MTPSGKGTENWAGIFKRKRQEIKWGEEGERERRREWVQFHDHPRGHWVTSRIVFSYHSLSSKLLLASNKKKPGKCALSYNTEHPIYT